jgi:hypothetical protein
VTFWAGSRSSNPGMSEKGEKVVDVEPCVCSETRAVPLERGRTENGDLSSHIDSSDWTVGPTTYIDDLTAKKN